MEIPVNNSFCTQAYSNTNQKKHSHIEKRGRVKNILKKNKSTGYEEYSKTKDNDNRGEYYERMSAFNK